MGPLEAFVTLLALGTFVNTMVIHRLLFENKLNIEEIESLKRKNND
jgi:hypothetical protein